MSAAADYGRSSSIQRAERPLFRGVLPFLRRLATTNRFALKHRDTEGLRPRSEETNWDTKCDGVIRWRQMFPDRTRVHHTSVILRASVFQKGEHERCCGLW